MSDVINTAEALNALQDAPIYAEVRGCDADGTVITASKPKFVELPADYPEKAARGVAHLEAIEAAGWFAYTWGYARIDIQYGPTKGEALILSCRRVSK